jgi:hypothetical protein
MTEPKEVKTIIKPSGNLSIAYRFATITLAFFTELQSRWYKKVNNKNIKTIPDNVEEELTPIALAYWLPGDGYYHQTQGSIVIATNSFTPDEIDLLRSILLKKFHIDSTRIAANKSKGQYMIRIPKREVPKVQELVKPHIPPTMAYRVGLPVPSDSSP